MPTHRFPCVVCGASISCSDDVRLSCGGPEGHGGCFDLPYIEFCSLACVWELQRRLARLNERHYAETAELRDDAAEG